MRTRSKTPKPEPVVPEKSIIEKPKKAPRPKAQTKPKKTFEYTPREVTVNNNSLLAEYYPQYKKELTMLVILFFRLFNYLFNVPLGGDVSKGDLPTQVKNQSIFSEEFCKNVLRLYPTGVSYVVNYYLNYNNTDQIYDDLINTDFERMMEDFTNSFLNLKVVKAVKLPEGLLDCFNFKEYTIIRPQEMSIEYAFSLLTKEQKIEIMVKCLESAFENKSVYSVSEREIVVYRGIVGYTINERDLFLQPAKGFVSTSTLESVAIDHTDIRFTMDKLLPSSRNLKDNFIIEMRVPPGVKFIDYNKIIEDDESNDWQKELIFPPGIQFNFIGTSKTTSGHDKLIVEVITGNTSFGESKQLKNVMEYLLSL
jgi:hypothetical protein